MSFYGPEELWAWVESFITRGQRISERAELRAQQFRKLCAKFGSPQRKFRSIHVAGSKGKGQTASFIACGLAAQGFRVGLYSSPHIRSYHERIQVLELQDTTKSHEPLPMHASTGNLQFEILQNRIAPSTMRFLDMEQVLLAEGSKLQQEFSKFCWTRDWNGSQQILAGEWCLPHFFAVLTLLAFRSFTALECDWAVLETGIGGRLCPTNAVLPELSVITPIQLEHMDVLGESIEQIAAEKAGIIKWRKPCVVGKQTEAAIRVLQQVSQQRTSPLFSLEHCLLEQKELAQQTNFRTRSLREALELLRTYHLHFCVRPLGPETMLATEHSRYGFDELHLRACSSTQLDNFALALLSLRILQQNGCISRTSEAWKGTLRCLEQSRIPGRFDCYCLAEQNCIVIFDGAHTPSSCQRLLQDLEHYLAKLPPDQEKGRMSLLFAAIQGKHFAEMAQVFAGHFDEIVLTRAGTFKKNDLSALEQTFCSALGQKMEQRANLLLEKEPLQALQGIINRGANVILVCGSFYLLGELLPKHADIIATL